MSFKIGLKLWSTNNNYLRTAERLYRKGLVQYIELFVVPGSFNSYKDIWSKLDCPYVIHAPHYKQGLNMASKINMVKTSALIKESLLFADHLNARYIIFHPGVNGDIKETIRQIKKIKGKHILIENKPYVGIGKGKIFCVGSTPKEIRMILDATEIGFCMDLGHAICSANAHNISPYDYIKDFLDLKPIMFHLTDGNYGGVYDQHLHIDEGTFPIQDILGLIPDKSMVTIETIKDSKHNLNDFIRDIGHIQKHLSSMGAKKAGKLIVRKAEITDMQNIFRLAINKYIRKASLSPRIFDWNTHKKWFAGKLSNKNCLFLVAEIGGEHAGHARFEIKNGSALTSICRDKKFKGKGIGTKLMLHAIKSLRRSNMARNIIAEVMPNNMPSIKLFERLHFKNKGKFRKKSRSVIKYVLNLV